MDEKQRKNLLLGGAAAIGLGTIWYLYSGDANTGGQPGAQQAQQRAAEGMKRLPG
jgi:hypothetical protein